MKKTMTKNIKIGHINRYTVTSQHSSPSYRRSADYSQPHSDNFLVTLWDAFASTQGGGGSASCGLCALSLFKCRMHFLCIYSSCSSQISKIYNRGPLYAILFFYSGLYMYVCTLYCTVCMYMYGRNRPEQGGIHTFLFNVKSQALRWNLCLEILTDCWRKL